MFNKEDFKLFKEYLVREPNVSLMELEKKERDSDFPIIKRGMQDLLRMLVVTAKPAHILELGTGVGFSSILMCEYSKSIKRIDTVELKLKNIKRAEVNIFQFDYVDKINIIHGDAVKVTEERTGLRDVYDLIFVDCAKAQYVNLWENIRGLVKPGGIIVTDDILQNGSILSSKFLLNRRDRTIHKRMREYLKMQMNDEDFYGAVFEIDDGVSILTRKVPGQEEVIRE